MPQECDNIIRVGRVYGSIIPDLPQRMTVVYVSDTEVHFTRKNTCGLFMMAIEKFCEIATN